MTKRFTDKCHSCLCPGYSLSDKCKCSCHQTLKKILDLAGVSLEDLKIMLNKITEEIESNPNGVEATRYEFYKFVTGKYTNKETEKLV